MNSQALEQNQRLKKLTLNVISESDNLYKFSYKFFKNNEDREDLVQETLIKAIKGLSNYESRNSCKLSSWLFSIMHNLAVDKYRNLNNSKRRNDNVSIDHSQIQISDSNDVELNIDIKYYLSKIEFIKNKNACTAFKMYLNGYPYLEISEILNLNLNTVKGHIYRCKKFMRNERQSKDNTI